MVNIDVKSNLALADDIQDIIGTIFWRVDIVFDCGGLLNKDIDVVKPSIDNRKKESNKNRNNSEENI